MTVESLKLRVKSYLKKLVTRKSGFTLIESVIVIVIMAILAAVVAIRWSPFDTIKLNNATRKVAADIRYAQKLAISISTQTRAASLFNANGYDVYQNYASVIRTPSPGDPCSTDSSNNFIVDFSDSRCSNYSGVTIATTIPSNRVEFNSIGAPYGGDSNPLTSPNNTVTVSVAGAGSQTITIEAGTGRVSY